MKKIKTKQKLEINDYDYTDTSDIALKSKRIKLKDLGLKLPEQPFSQVISIRLPTNLLNRLKAVSSENDVPYHSMLKIILAEGLNKAEKNLT